MQWSEEETAAAVVGRPQGKVDETSWESFAEHLTAAVRRAAGGGRSFVLDLSGLDYMSSRGLRALTLGKREAGEAVAITLAAPNARIREILAISRYDKLFRIEEAVPAG